MNLRPELVQAIKKTKIMEITSFSILSLRELISKINNDLGDFTNTFRYKRKQLNGASKTSKAGILFKKNDTGKDWSINEGGGTEVQYHIIYRESKIRYGIGFNAQYVPFKNNMSPVQYIQPFADAYLTLVDSGLVNKFKEKGFTYHGFLENELESLQENRYYLFGKEINITDSHILDRDYTEMLHELKNDLFELYCKVFEKRNNMLKFESVDIKYIKLLKANKNLILTGAPGTGKTFLAKRIAKQLTGESEDSPFIQFVQFHPSYDYTDFVEGLRPIKKDNSELGFELRDGLFKSFCRSAINQEEKNNFDELYIEFIDELLESNIEFETPTHKKKFKVEINSNKTCVAIPDTDVGTRMSITKPMIKDYILSGKIRDWKPYTVPIAEYFKKKYKVKTEIAIQEEKPFVLIIDEINRAEISKVFGELFFSIDPGYRGKKGKVKTQYANLQNEDDVFRNGFYVPENVYIIGTMNDIDRSVESMDFAMRRRFAWKEVKALDRISMWDDNIEDHKNEAETRMKKLNEAIEKVPGLNAAYHIGPAYFLKLELYKDESNSFEFLWGNHIEGVLFEYLRGFPNSTELLGDLKRAYNNIDDVKNT